MQGPRGGLPAPDSYAGSAAPSITGVGGQPPPIFTRQGVPAGTSTTPMFVKVSFGFGFRRWGWLICWECWVRTRQG
jgi:hypothetical protein